MSEYRFCFWRDEDVVSGHMWILCADDLEALDRARLVLNDTEIEAWQEDRRVFRMRPDGDAAA
jgi:hypothetical protein